MSPREQTLFVECLHECREIINTNEGLDYYGNVNRLEDHLAKELDDLLMSCDDYKTIIQFKPFESISLFDSIEKANRVFDDLQRRILANAKLAEEMETEIYSNINSYEFDCMGIEIKLCIDVLCLYFEPRKKTTRSLIKQFITRKTGDRYYIRNDDADIREVNKGFTIQLHNIKNKKDLYEVIAILSTHYEAPISLMKVKGIELALDFYNAPHIGLVTALFKSIRLKHSMIQFKRGKPDLRIYKYSKCSIPSSPHSMLELLEHAWNIGINHRDNDLIYYHLYHKKTDNNGKPLPCNEWRIRIEVRLNENILYSIGNDLINLNHLVKEGFTYLRFTQLKSDVSSEDKLIYKTQVKPFGMELESHYTPSRNKTKLSNIVEKNAQLNTEISKRSSNLARFNFKKYS